MSGYKKIKKAFLISLLAASLVSFGFSTARVFAEAEATTTPESGVSGGTASTTSSGGAAVIETGDAAAQTKITNEVNTNITKLNEASTTESTTVVDSGEGENEDGNASSTPDQSACGEGEGCFASSSPEIIVENENDAMIVNNSTTTADTGNNEANNNGGGGGASINTGNAGAGANIINVANTNIFNSEGMLLFFNNFFSPLGNFDLRNLNLDFFNSSAGGAENGGGEDDQSQNCSLSGCPNGSADIVNGNTATIVNNIVVRSSTGGNTADGNGGDSEIDTGNAYAAANVVNVANTNIVDSKYLLLIMNNFGGMNGDLVLPGKDFFSRLLSVGGVSSTPELATVADFQNASTTESASSTVAAENENSANIENNISVGADTGNNETSGNGGDSEIDTGNAYAAANVQNYANTNVFGGSPSVMILLRVHGSWSGNVFSAPEGISWEQTPSGIRLFSEEPLGKALTPLRAAEPREKIAVSNTNTANIKNNIRVIALTGDNKITGGGGAAKINTGGAYAAVNAVNVVNTNIVGRNWILAIVNIFGDWKGDVAFGRPDLWIGGRAEVVQNPVGPGARITYHFTVKNNGDADATGVKIKDLFNDRLLSFTDALGGSVSWDVGDIPAGEVADFSYDAVVNSNIPFGRSAIESKISVSSFETDENEDDNTDFITVTAFRQQRRQNYGTHIVLTPDPVLRIVKTNNATTTLALTASTTVDYKIVIKNDGGPAYHSVLFDTLKDESGNIVNKQQWNLDEIYPNEKITINYTVAFSASNTPSGVYTNYARVKSIGRNPSLNPFYGWFVNSPVATSSVEIAGGTEREATGGEEEGGSGESGGGMGGGGPESVIDSSGSGSGNLDSGGSVSISGIKNSISEIEKKVTKIKEAIVRISPQPLLANENRPVPKPDGFPKNDKIKNKTGENLAIPAAAPPEVPVVMPSKIPNPAENPDNFFKLLSAGLGGLWDGIDKSILLPILVILGLMILAYAARRFTRR